MPSTSGTSGNCRTVEKFMLDWTSGNHLVQSPTEGAANFKIRSGCSGHFPAEFWKSLWVEIPWFLGSQFQCLTIHIVIFFFPLYSWENYILLPKSESLSEVEPKAKDLRSNLWSVMLALKFHPFIPVLLSKFYLSKSSRSEKDPVFICRYQSFPCFPWQTIPTANNPLS